MEKMSEVSRLLRYDEGRKLAHLTEGPRQERTRPNRKYQLAISILAFNGEAKPC